MMGYRVRTDERPAEIGGTLHKLEVDASRLHVEPFLVAEWVELPGAPQDDAGATLRAIGPANTVTVIGASVGQLDAFAQAWIEARADSIARKRYILAKAAADEAEEKYHAALAAITVAPVEVRRLVGRMRQTGIDHTMAEEGRRRALRQLEDLGIDPDDI